MSDDEDEQVDSDANLFDGSFDGGADNMGFGPLIPTENERSLMERVRQELKHELKHVRDISDFSSTLLFNNYSHMIHLLLFLSYIIGLQGENCGHKRGNFTQETSWETSR